MAGRPGRSGGANRLSIAEHLQRGTHNVTRHGPRPSDLKPLVLPRTESIPTDLLDGLTGRGAVFVRETWQQYTGWTPASLVLLREAGYLITQLEDARGQRGERAAQRLLLATLGALHLRD